MKEQALFCDGTAGYVIPPEPECDEKITLRFRVALDDVVTVRLITRMGAYDMQKESSKERFDYYSIQWVLTEKPFYYHFEIQEGSEFRYYNRLGVVNEASHEFDFMIVPGFSTPDWAKGAVMYQIYTDRFYNGDKTNDVETGEYYYIDGQSEKVTDWNKYPKAKMGVREFYGGDLQGVMDKLDYLQDLGVDVIYFNPLFVSPSNHKYDTQDYDYVDPHFGVIVNDGGKLLKAEEKDNSKATKYQKRVTDLRNLEASNELFIKLVEEIHRRGMKVIVDGVFNHCGSFNKWMDREKIYDGQAGYKPGAFVSADSPYRKYFYFTENEESNWPDNKNYKGWWDHNTLPKMNFEESDELEEYIMSIGRKWVSPPYNCDGWRLDVAADLGGSEAYNHEFWKKFRNVVKEANPNAIILAEHYGDCKNWLQGDQWDTVMNYDAFMEPITWFLTGMEKHSDERREELQGNADYFVDKMKKAMATMMTPSLQVAMNELSNHDHSRFLTRTNHAAGRVDKLGHKAAEENVDVAVMREAVVMQMTWPGAPTLYYGDEAGVCGFTDPDNRRTYPWGNEDEELIDFHKEMIRIHKESEVFKAGSVLMLGWRRNVLAYARFDEKEQIVVVLNNSNERQDINLPVWKAEIPSYGKVEQLIYTDEDGYSAEKKIYSVNDGSVVVNMGARSAVVLKSI